MPARGRVTAAELAEEFETSVATARRDLEPESVRVELRRIGSELVQRNA
jgi:DeoR/GlpR family transcriptional regulator of sugar metabolism